MVRGFRSALALLVLFAGGTAAAFAQSQATTGVIQGRVTAAGTPLPAASVALQNTSTNFEKKLLTDSAGRFRAVLLPLGPYRVTVSAQGFSDLVREGIDLGVGQTLDLDLPLNPPTVSEAITVTGEAPLIEVSRTEGETRIDAHAIDGLPNNGRNFLDFVKLTPGVTIVQGPDGDEMSINGQKGISNNVSVDGADFNNPFFGEQRGGQRPPFTFNLDAVQEVVVVADGASAEFGRSSGGFVNVITKAGTNTMQGSAHLFYKNDSLEQTPVTTTGASAEKGSFHQYQGGFTLGGPLQKDRLFYFLATDIQRAARTKQTNASRMDPQLVSFLNGIGIPSDNAPIQRTDDAEVGLAKVDWQASESELVTFRYNYTNSNQVNGTFDVDQWGRSANGVEKDYSHAGTATVISTLSPTVLNELRAQYAKEWRPRPYDGPNIPGQNRPFPDTAIAADGDRFGMPFFLPVKYNDTRKQLTDNVSLLHADHTFKAGAEFNEVASAQTFLGFANGRFIFSSVNGFINYYNNPHYVECSDGSSSQTGACPAGTSVTGPVLLYLQQAGVGNTTVEQAGTQTIRQREPALFIQDEWQAQPNLTLSYGLRWEGLQNPDPVTPPSQVFFAPFIGQTRNGQQFPSNGKIPNDYKMFQPRLGMSWVPDADRKAVVRATAGVFNALIPALDIASSRSTNGSLGQSLFRNSFLGSIGVLPPPPPYTTLINGAGSPFRPDIFVFSKNWETPRTLSYSLSYEREVMSETTGLIKLNYAKTDHITRFINRNDPKFGDGVNGPWTSGLTGPSDPNGLGVLTSVESTAKSRYKGVTLGLDRRLTGNFAYQVYYTWSQDKSDDDNERDPFTFTYADPTQLDREYSWSNRDQRHRINAWMLYRLTNWFDINLRYAYRSAQPKSITASGADAQTPQDRINPDGSVTLRNLGRKDNTYSSLDLRLSRDFPLGAVTIEPIVEVFNVLNRTNFLRPEVTNLAFNFDGTVRSGAGDPRQIQLGLKVLW